MLTTIEHKLNEIEQVLNEINRNNRDEIWKRK
jgi:chaperonin cofactor prefoldin